jgi:fatty acid amide hydrolase
VPVTIKECLDIAGTPSTFGLPLRARIIEKADEAHVAKLRAAGAIPLAKTNVAQMLLMVETDNTLYGRTNNPWDVERSPGGSSGGEGAIIAARGSCLGLGTDVGGSVRVPAHACGITSIKPTAGRCPDPGRWSYPVGQTTVESQVGVLATRVEDVAAVLGIISFATATAQGPAASIHEPKDVSKITVGWFDDDGVTKTCPTARRAVREAAEALSAAGARVFEWRPHAVATAQELYYGAMTAGGTAFKDIAGSDKVDPRIQALLRAAAMPNKRARFLARALSLTGQGAVAGVLRGFGERTTADYWRLVARTHDYRAAFLKTMDEANGMDLMLSPGFHVPAFPHGAAADPTVLGTHTILFNLLGFPAGTLPWTRVRPHEEAAPGLPANSRKLLKGSAGLPFNVQIAGRPWREDQVLAAMRIVEAAAGKRPDYPRKPPL